MKRAGIRHFRERLGGKLGYSCTEQQASSVVNVVLMPADIDRRAWHLRRHSFRHTLNSLLRNKGDDSARIRAALGWSDETMQDNYTHWNPESFTGHREIVETVFRHQDSK